MLIGTPGILLVGVQLPFQVVYGSLKRAYDNYDLSLLVGQRCSLTSMSAYPACRIALQGIAVY